ncbi:MAG: short-chain fatty acid transporter [Chthoniobacterales bacterium]|nr:short-chain fatty acid transporter [Chthoniobacterales bacterium]
MISRLGLLISRAFRSVMPDPFVLAVVLTFATIALALLLTPTPFPKVIDAWSSDLGIWSLLKFAMQMSLILVTGYALATSPPVARLTRRLAQLPTTGANAAALVAVLATTTGVLNWGLGLIVGAVAAREVGAAMHRKGISVHYPLLAAAGYLGLMVWHGGFSGTAPLKVTRAADIAEIFGATPPISAIPLDRTLFSPMNLFITGGLLILLPLIMAALAPRDAVAIQRAESFGISDNDGVVASAEPTGGGDDRKPLLPRLLEDTPWISWALVLLIAIWAWRYYFPGDRPSGIRELTPDTVNLTMLGFGLLLHRTPMSYVRAVERAAKGAAGIILQFPLYAGIMGIMGATGLTALFATSLAAIGTGGTLPLTTFFSAAVVNIFVPSGGGQWAIQGPIAMHSAIAAGIDPAKMVMAVAYGDQLTNMLQPFWALPLLAITKVQARDIVGYTAVAMLAGAAWIALGLLLF